MAAEPAAHLTAAVGVQAPATAAATAEAGQEAVADPDAAAASGDLGQQLLAVATTLRKSTEPSILQLVRGLRPVCKAGRSAAIATVTELYLGPAASSSESGNPTTQLPWHLLLSAEHLRALSVSWEQLAQLAAKQHEGQCFGALFAPRLQRLDVAGELLADSGANLVQLLQFADSLQTMQLRSDVVGILSFGALQPPPTLKQLHRLHLTWLWLCLQTVAPWLQQHEQLQHLAIALPGNSTQWQDQAALSWDWVGSLSPLTKLMVTCGLEGPLPSSWSGLQQLRQLHISKGTGVQLPEEVCSSWQALEELHLGANQLTSLPDTVSCLTSLTALHLSHNQLTQLPAGIAALPSLVQLSVRDNRLTALPPGLDTVTWLDLSSNTQLTGLRGLTAFPNLEVARVGWCGFTNLRGVNLSPLTALRELDLSSNGVAAAGGLVLPSALHTLDLNGNSLTSLADWRQLSSCCTGLQELQLQLAGSDGTRQVGALGVFPHVTRLGIRVESRRGDIAAAYGSAEEVWGPVSSWVALQPQLVELKLAAVHMQQLIALPTTLTRLELSGMCQLPPAALHLPQLRCMGVHGGYLFELPPWFGQLTQLQHLLLDRANMRHARKVAELLPGMQVGRV